jgi:Amt family ammonium transporter
VHGVGGVTGTLLAGFFAIPPLGGAGLAEGVTVASQFGVQLIAVLAAGIWSLAATWALVMLTEALCGLRTARETTVEGLDFAVHGEKGYNF